MGLNYQLIAGRIREAREALGWSQEELGKRLKDAGGRAYEGATVWGWENVRRKISLDDLYRVAEVTGRPFSWFLGEVLADNLEHQLRKLVSKTIGDLLPGRRLPVIKGSIPAGGPNQVEELIEDYISYPLDIPGDYAIPVKGDSMIGAGIWDGDYISFRLTAAAKPGDVVVARVDGEVTCKYLVIGEDGRWLLRSTNPRKYPDISLREGLDEIVGVVEMVFHKPPALDGALTFDAEEDGDATAESWGRAVRLAIQAGITPQGLEQIAQTFRSLRPPSEDG